MRYLLWLALALASCMPGAVPERPEPSHRQQKLLQASYDEVWKAARTTVDEAQLSITDADESEGALRASMRRRSRSGEGLERELSRVAELSKARQLGLGQLAEYVVVYTVEVRRAEDDRTGLDVSTEITAVDQQIVFLPPGIYRAIPRNFDVPSKGVLERQFVEQIASHLLLSEEMLYSLGVLGRE
ncbi:MAG: hypothetical protein ABW298_15500 [Candidatus Binatia bacterium]